MRLVKSKIFQGHYSLITNQFSILIRSLYLLLIRSQLHRPRLQLRSLAQEHVDGAPTAITTAGGGIRDNVPAHAASA